MSDSKRLIPKQVTDFLRTPYFWGIMAVLLLLSLNVMRDSSYLAVSVNPLTGNLSGNLIDILRLVAPVLMISIGMCLVIATEGIDLSVGSAMVIGGAVSMEMLKGGNGTLGEAVVAITVALVLTSLLGLLNGALVAVVGLQPFISTLVTMLAGRGIAKVITSGQNTSASNESYRWLANGYVAGIPVVFIISMAIVAVVAIVVRRTALGMMIEAIGMDARASRLAGINSRGLLLTVYTASGLLAGVAGILATSSVMTVDISKTGYQMELDAILAVVIGGTLLSGGKFSIGGAVIGAFLIATLDKTVVYLGISSEATPAFKAIVIVVLCLLQSDRVRTALRSRRKLPTAIPQETLSA